MVHNKTSSPSSSNATFNNASRSERSEDPPREAPLLISFPIERRLYLLRFFVVVVVKAPDPEDELFVLFALLCCCLCRCLVVVVVVVVISRAAKGTHALDLDASRRESVQILAGKTPHQKKRGVRSKHLHPKFLRHMSTLKP